MQLRRDERGVTLTEMLVAVMVLGVIIVPLANAVIGFVRLTDDTTRRFTESRDVQIAAAYFAQDAQSLGVHDWAAYPYPLLQSVELNAPPTGGLYPCGTGGTPAAVLRLAWDDPDTLSGAPQVIRVSYVVMVVGSERQLHRLVCSGVGPTPSADIVVAHSLDATPPVVTCSSPCTAAPTVPASVKLTLFIHAPSSTDPPVSVVLTGQRRQT
jgi:prepilin-type N-terminal cleavage/methylation domain-containing protein